MYAQETKMIYAREAVISRNYNDVSTNQKLYLKIRCIRLFESFKYKRITQFGREY